MRALPAESLLCHQHDYGRPDAPMQCSIDYASDGWVIPSQVILPTAPGASNEGPRSRVLGLAPPFLGPGFWLGARCNRLVETVKMRKKRKKTGKKWARCGLKGVKDGS
eukprot:COSAG04_NODE_6123_length_1403_cov_2.138037_2_plen_108_part_00